MSLKKYSIFSTILAFFAFTLPVEAAQVAWYVTFSGESKNPVNNIYSLSVKDGSVQGEVLSNTLGLHELRNLVVTQNGTLFLLNANKHDSRIAEFGPINSDGLTRNFIANVVTTDTVDGMIHPFFITLDYQGYYYVSAQDTNIVLRLNGENAPQPWTTAPLTPYLQKLFPTGHFYSGTFVAAENADIKPQTPVPSDQGGLSLSGKNSVRGLVISPDNVLYVADEAKDRIMLYDRNGNYIGNITDKNLKKPDELLYHAADNTIYISSPGSNSILKYDVKTKTLHTFIHDPNHLDHTSGIAFGEDGHFYVANRKSMSIYRYTSKGNKPVLFAGPFTDSPEAILPVYDNASSY